MTDNENQTMTVDELREDIDEARERLAADAQALSDKLNVKQRTADSLAGLRDTASEKTRAASQTVRETVVQQKQRTSNTQAAAVAVAVIAAIGVIWFGVRRSR